VTGPALALVLLAAGPAAAALAQAPAAPPAAAPAERPEPHRRGGGEALEFRGPGREEPEPDVDEVVLGWFGPGDPDHPAFGDAWRGGLLALEEENRAGGYRGSAFSLVAFWSENPWAAAVADLLRATYERGAWAVVGGVDGETTHLAVQLALKSRFLLLSPGSSDVTADHANVPWLFSLAPSDAAQAERLVPALAAAADGGAFGILAATDHDSRAALAAHRRLLSRRGLAPAALVSLASGGDDLPFAVSRLLAPAPRVVLVLAPASTAGRVVARLRADGYRGTVFGGATLSLAAFGRAAGAAAEGVVAPWLLEDGPGWAAFAAAYERRWGGPPDAAAAHGYDGVRMVVAAVRRAGLNRARIRDAVRELSPWAGASGTVRWDALGRNARPVGIARWRAGRLAPPDRGER
jgi:branched-chain amino acid transport system substrate-binding protein